MAKLEAQPREIRDLMIVKHSSGSAGSGPEKSPGNSGEAGPLLTRQDVDRLTAYKWRYTLESHGFSASQATRLLYIKWLYARGTIGG